MKIGIIGAGNIGACLAKKLGEVGHEVRLANSRGPESISSLAANIGATAVSVMNAVKEAEVIIVSIPQKSIINLPAGLFANVPDDVVVLDTGNYYPQSRDGSIEPIENGLPESRWVEQQIGHSVVKAFNSISVDSLANGSRCAGAPDRIALPVAGDDNRAKDIVIKLMDSIGFDGIDAGSLDDSWRQQPGNPAYCKDLSAKGLPGALAAANRVEAPRLREIESAEYRRKPRQGR